MSTQNTLPPLPQQLPVSVLIPTLNEARNLPDCLASVAWASEVIVFDSYSSDTTLDIAQAQGARIVQREFDNFSTHKNWALSNIEFINEWILILDADERVSPELATEIGQALASNPTHDGYYIARKIIWRGRWLRHGGRYPDYNLRLLRRGKGLYEHRLVHEHMIIEGSTGTLKHALLHNDDKGIERFIERHNHYSTLEAVEILRAKNTQTHLQSQLFTRGPQQRRALKNFAYCYLPARPIWVFFYMYFIKFGFLDGRAGLDSALLRMSYEYQINLKLTELSTCGSPLERRWRSLLNPKDSPRKKPTSND